MISSLSEFTLEESPNRKVGRAINMTPSKLNTRVDENQYRETGR